jgi:hypothetical protein
MSSFKTRYVTNNNVDRRYIKCEQSTLKKINLRALKIKLFNFLNYASFFDRLIEQSKPYYR